MKLTLNKSEYRDLLDLLILGDWMLSSHKLEHDHEDSKYKLIQKVMSSADKMGFGNLIEFHNESFMHTKEYEETSENHNTIDAYDEETFWGELPSRLANRDIHKKYSDDEINAFSRDEYFSELFGIEEKYEKEFDAHGLLNVTIDTQTAANNIENDDN